MKISNKLHRGCAVGAAVLLILGIMVNISTFFSLQPGYQAEKSLVLLGNTGVQVLTNVFLIFVLFRGKKDKVSGTVFAVLAGFALLRSVFPQLLTLTMLGNQAHDWLTYNILSLAASVCTVIFRGSASAECYKPGSFCAGGKKLLLILTSVASVLCTNIGTILLYRFDLEIGTWMAQLFIASMDMLPQLLTALALAVPVMEADTAMGNDPAVQNLFDRIG